MCSTTKTWTRPGPVAVSQVAHLPDPCHLTHVPLFQLPRIQTRQELPSPERSIFLLYPPCTSPALLQQPWLSGSFWKAQFLPTRGRRACCPLLPERSAVSSGSAPTLSLRRPQTSPWPGSQHPLYSLARICLPCPLFMTAAPAPSSGLRDHSTFGSVPGRMDAYSGLWDQEPRAAEGRDKNIPDRKKTTHGARRVQRPLPPLARAQDRGAGTEEAGWGV